MLKQLLCATAVAAGAASAQAQAASKWQFTWTGFLISNPTQSYFDPSRSVTGTFSGIDADHDGTITLTEVTELTVGGVNWATCGDGPFIACGISRFSYSAQGGLDLRTQQISYEENPWTGTSVTRTTTYDTSDAISYFAWGDNVDEWYVHGFTDETVTSISAVPEPQSYALFGAGLLLLGAATRRRALR